jgi:hypothetical protein
MFHVPFIDYKKSMNRNSSIDEKEREGKTIKNGCRNNGMSVAIGLNLPTLY